MGVLVVWAEVGGREGWDCIGFSGRLFVFCCVLAALLSTLSDAFLRQVLGYLVEDAIYVEGHGRVGRNSARSAGLFECQESVGVVQRHVAGKKRRY